MDEATKGFLIVQEGKPSAVNPIRVKFLSKALPGEDASEWLCRFPGSIPKWGNCEYIFDKRSVDYDWLVVYDDFPPAAGERFTLWKENLACSRDRTLLITTEPSPIKVYGTGYVRQFGHVLTSQEPWAIRHHRAIFSQTGLIWFYGAPPITSSYDHITANPPENKTSEISTVCSSKKHKHALHHARVAFTNRLKQSLPELDIFGHGVRYLADKAEALDPYRYHVAIENHVCEHHWTEKLADSFLGLCLPFYHGCPNVFDYFPEESIIPINIHRFEDSLERISKAIRDGEFEKRLPAIREARRLVLQEYSLFPLLSRLIEERTPPGQEKRSSAALPGIILSRHALRRRNPIEALSIGLRKLSMVRRGNWINYRKNISMKSPETQEWGTFAPTRLPARVMIALIRSGLSRGFLRKSIMKAWLGIYGAAPVDICYHGSKIRVVPDGNITDQKLLFRSGFRDREEFALIDRSDSQKSTFVDIGANVGYYSLVAAQLGYRKIVAIEPNPGIHERLAFNIHANNLREKTLLKNCAVSDKPGTMFLKSSGDPGSGFISAENTDGQGIAVPVETLGSILTEGGIEGISAIKIDVEGHEDRVLIPYFREASADCRPSVLVIEHIHQQRWKTDLIAFLTELGYRSVLVTRSNTILTLP